MSKEMTLREEMNAMINGNYTSDLMTEEDKNIYFDNDNVDGSENENVDDNDNENNDNQDEQSSSTEQDGSEENKDNNREDTDAKTSLNDDAETNDGEVAQNQDTDKSDSKVEQEDTQANEVDSEKLDKSVNETDDTNSDIDYKQQFEELQAKYDESEAFRKIVTSDFKANGRIVNGIDDPEKIVKNLQMSTGLTKKLEGFKTIKPLIKPLEDRGLLQDTQKFDLLMRLADNDKDALKHYLKENNIDPVELDIDDDSDYSPTSTIASKEEMMFNDMVDLADDYGVGEQFANTVLTDWDEESASALFDGQDGMSMSKNLAEQMSNGVYDKVMSIVANMEITEVGFNRQSSLSKYEAASDIFNKASQEAVAEEDKIDAEKLALYQANLAAEEARVKSVKAEEARLVREEEEKAYASKIAEKEAIADRAREEAANVSKPRATSTQVKKTNEVLSQSDLRAEWRKMMAG